MTSRLRLLSLPLLTAAVMVMPAALSGQVREGDAAERAAYWRARDAYPFVEEPAMARIRAFESLRLDAPNAPSVPQPGGRNRFTPLGPFAVVAPNSFFFSAPQPDAGRVSSIALHPTLPGTFWVGTPNGGVWTTANGGFTWQALTDNECAKSVGGLVVDQVNPDIIYAGMGHRTESTAQACGLLRSTNGGATWTRLAATEFNLQRTWAMHLDPRSAGSTQSATLLVANNNGLWRSTNGGEVFTRLRTGTHSSVVGHPANGAIMYAAQRGAMSANAVLIRSADGGATWAPLVDLFPDAGAGRVEMATSAADPDALWIVAERLSDARLLGLYRWHPQSGIQKLNANNLYTGATRLDFGSQSWWNLVVAVDPTNAQRIYLGGLRAYRSDDGGNSFTEMASNIHVDWHAIAVHPTDPRRVFAGNDGGLVVSTDGGTTFTTRNGGMATMLFYPGIAVHPTIPGYVLGGTQDNGSMRSGFFSVFEGVTSGDGGFAAINPQNPSIMWTTCQRSHQQDCIYRISGGSVVSRRAGIDVSDRSAFLPPLVMSPSDPTRLYFGTQRLWRTINEGLAWTAQSVDLSKGSGHISTVVEAPNAPAAVWVGTSDGKVWVSRDATESWTDVSAGLPDRFIAKLAVDVTNPDRVYAAIGGFGTGKVFRTTNGGTTWENVGGGLPDVPGTAVLLIPGSQRVFFASDLGVWESTTGAAPWTRSEGLPPVRTNDLVFQAPFNLVIAATFGRGLYSMDIGPQSTALRGDVNRDGTVNAADALLIQRVITGQALTAPQTAFPHGDANCDGVVNSADVLLVLRFAVGASVGTACVGTVR